MEKFTKAINLWAIGLFLTLAAIACAPNSSHQKADPDGKLNANEIAVWVQSAAATAGSFRVLFATNNQADGVELCKIPPAGVTQGFTCNSTQPGYLKLAPAGDKGVRKLWAAESLAIADKDGYAIFAKRGEANIYDKPREAYFTKAGAGGAGAGTPIQFTTVKEVMGRNCSGAQCHDNAASPRDLFAHQEAAFAPKKAEIGRRLSLPGNDKDFMPRGKTLTEIDKKILTDYLKQTP